MWEIALALLCSHALVGAIVYWRTRRHWYRRGLDDAWMDYAGASFQ